MESENVDVVITTFNRADTISNSVSSVLSQSYMPHKVVVVDDGSADNTAEVLKAFGERIEVIRQSNQGIAVARNKGISHTCGELIAFQDSDDEWYPFKLGLQIKVMKALPKVKFIFTDVDAVGERGNFPRLVTEVFSDLQSRFGLGKNEFFPYCASLMELGIVEPDINPDVKVYYGPIFKHLWVKPFIINPTVLVRRDCLVPYPEGSSFGTDARFYIQLAKSHWFGFLDVPTMAYSIYGKGNHISGYSNVTPRYSEIVKAHQLFYGLGESLNPTHRGFYRKQMAYFLHRIALDSLLRIDRKGAIRKAANSIRIVWKQIPAYLILALSVMPNFFLKLIQRYRQTEDRRIKF